MFVMPGTSHRSLPLRRLTAEEVDRLGYAGKLQLNRQQAKLIFLWRNTKWFTIETPQGEVRMTLKKKELALHDLAVDGA